VILDGIGHEQHREAPDLIVEKIRLFIANSGIQTRLGA